MKKHIILSVLLLSLFVSGCSAIKGGGGDVPSQASPDITDYAYPLPVMNAISALKNFKIATSVLAEDETFLIVSSGMNSDYSISIIDVSEEGDELFVTVDTKINKGDEKAHNYTVESVDGMYESVNFKALAQEDHMPFIVGFYGDFPETSVSGAHILILDSFYDDRGIYVSGISSVWEAAFFWKLKDVNQKVLKEGQIMAASGAPDWGYFSLEIKSSDSKGELDDAYLIGFYEQDAKTGKLNELIEFALRVIE